ncbi:MAG: undecaprenyl-diphosphate phosphatase [Terracidiphilus sp.]
MTILEVIILAIIQGLAELLPISSSAHVVVAEKLMGLDPSSPQMTLLLVMLHTGTMFAVIVYFWKTWKRAFFSDGWAFRRFVVLIVWASVLTGIVGEVLKRIIEKTLFRGAEKAEIEQLFSHLELIAPALAAAGLLILIAGIVERRQSGKIRLAAISPRLAPAALTPESRRSTAREVHRLPNRMKPKLSNPIGK